MHMDAPGNAEEIEQGLRLLRIFRNIRSSTTREQIIAFVAECENHDIVSSPPLAESNSQAIVRGSARTEPST